MLSPLHSGPSRWNCGHRRSAAEEALSILCRGLVTGSAPGHAHAALNRAQRSLAALNGFGQGGATTMLCSAHRSQRAMTPLVVRAGAADRCCGTGPRRSCTLPAGAAAQFSVKKVLTIPLNRRITAKLTVELGCVPFGCTACRKAVRSPWMHSPK